MQKYLFIAITFLFITAFSTEQQPWTKLGDVTISSQLDNESIILSGKDKYKWIKFKAANQPFQLLSIDIYYQSGEIQTIDYRTSIGAGLESKKFELKTGQAVKKVLFQYKLPPGKHNDNVIVELYGSN